MYIFYLDFVRVYNEDTLNFARDFGVSKDRNLTEIFGILETGWIC